MSTPRAILLVGLTVLAAALPALAAAPAAAQAPAEAPAQDRATSPALAIGVTESDPRLLVPSGPTKHIANKLRALRPSYVRVLVPWHRIQPQAGRKPNWDVPTGGCPKIAPHCKSPRGLRAQLQAIKQRQESEGGWKILAVPHFTPLWAMAGPPTGCQQARHRRALAQMPRIAAYRTFLRGLNALADKVGVKIDYITPWNEPNHPAFLQPQRAVCSASAKAIAPQAYARLARAAAKELRYQQTLVLGSLAGLESRHVYGVGAADFIRGLPRDVACLGGPFAQHAYIGRRGRSGADPPRANPAAAASNGLIGDVLAALDAKRCPTIKPLWITETGTFDRRCEAMSAALRSWARNDRVDAAFQYTFRESRDYPVGLVSASLRTTYPSYRAWLAFAGGPLSVPPSPC